MAKRPLPDQALLLKLLRYDFETGTLYWRTRPIEYFSDKKLSAYQIAAAWNGHYAGKPALNADSGNGYLVGLINAVQYSAHRIIWKMVFDEEPEMIDHINGDGTDNRLCNLRPVNAQVNNQNRPLTRGNTTGASDVQWEPNRGKFRARIRVNKIRINLGSFEILEDAILARKKAERQFGFHPNHGRKKAAHPSPKRPSKLKL